MNNLLPTSPEVSSSLGTLHIRQDLTNHSVSIYFKHWNLWHVDTSQVEISKNVIHFVEPDGEIVGIKCFSAMGDQQ